MARITVQDGVAIVNALGMLAQAFGGGGAKVPRFVRKLGDGFTRSLAAIGVVQPVGDLVDRARLAGQRIRVSTLDAEGAVVEQIVLEEADVAGLDDVLDGVEEVALRVQARLAS
jgi:hypothetical protein